MVHHMDPTVQSLPNSPNGQSRKPNLPLPSLSAPGNLTAEQLNAYCGDMRSDLFLGALLEDITNPRHFIRNRGERRQLANLLAAQMNACSDAPKFVLDFLVHLSEHFQQHPELKPIYEKLLAQITLDALHRYISWAYLDARRKHMNKNANVNIGCPKPEDDGDALEKKDADTPEVHRASSRQNGERAFDDEIEADASDAEQDEETESDEDDTGTVNHTNSIRTTDYSNAPTLPGQAITEVHVQRCLDMIRTLPSPVSVFLAIDIFRLKQILKNPYPSQLFDPANLSANTIHYGILLIRRLLDTRHEAQAIAAMKKLKLRQHFSLIDFALPLMKSLNPRQIIAFAQSDDHRRVEMLEIVNHQLSHFYAWKIDAVPETMLASIPPAVLAIPPIRRFCEHRFQKSMVTACHAFIQPVEHAAGRFPFLRLAHQHVALRWLLARRSAQQRDEKGCGGGGGENYDDLLKRFANDKGVGRDDGTDAAILRKIVIKEMVDSGDEDGAVRFARGWRLEDFVEGLKREEPRTVRGGGVGGGRERKRVDEPEIKDLAAVSIPVYCIPDTAQIRWIRGADDLSMLKETLAGTVLCGIDTEWLPSFNGDRSRKRTALMQMACQSAEKDRPVVVLLVDMVALLDGDEQGAKEEVEQILREFFDDDGVRKLGYEFQGDQKLLGATFPALTARPNNFLDLRHVRMARSAPAPVAPGEAIDTKKKWRAKREKVKRDAAEEGERMGGGLGGLVTWFLGARLDKRQQLSDWEKRPLREEQVIYAATDAHVLLDLHKILQDQDHAVMAMVEYNANNGVDGEDVVAEWAGAERGGWWL